LRVVSWIVGLTLADRYRLDAALGSGSAPSVWAATHLPTGRRVALRRLEAPELPKRAMAQLAAEVRACAVDHPNVAEMYEVLEGAGDTPLLVSELLRGETLAQRLSRSPMLPLREAASLILPVVSAVGTAHARGIVHGGLTASSIFLWAGSGAVPAVKVLNFGLAKWTAAIEHAPASVRGGGPPPSRWISEYAPPEQTLPGRSVDHRADIWALGVILYECLSGLRPLDFVPREADVAAAAAAFVPIEQRAPAVPRALADIIAHLLVSDLEHRAQNLIELFHALSPLAERPSPSFGWPGSERRISGLTQRMLAPEWVPTVPPPAAAVTPVPAEPQRRPFPWRSAALAATAVAAAELVALLWLATRLPSSDGQAIIASAPLGTQNAHAEMLLSPVEGRTMLVDDFEDGNGVPASSAFGNWQAFSVNPAGRALPLKLGPGHDSRGSAEMSWFLEDARAAQVEPAGAGLRSVARSGVLDLSRYSTVTFAHRYAPMTTPGFECKTAGEFVVFVTCRSLAEEPELELAVSVSADWSTASVKLSDLKEVGGSSSPATEREACLAAVDSFGFRADASDGQESDCHGGVLWLDDIIFR
jgi:eukaryotic-like serine/threonine-protein kinase